MNTTINALTVCNACDIDQQHNGCHMGYCADCCPANGNH